MTSLGALQAPFLIDNDALETAVAQSDIAKRMLDGMTPAGVVGLAMFPEDLRHPFAFEPNSKPLLAPEDFVGKTIRSTTSAKTNALLVALGAKPIDTNDGFEAAVADGSIQGAESGLREGESLPGSPTATGNVSFFAKYDVLAVNAAAFDALTENQRAALQTAAAATLADSLRNHPTDVQAGAAWCGDGGRVVLASNAQVAAFAKASQPVYAALEQDPFTKHAIADLQALKATVTPAPAAAACDPVVVPSLSPRPLGTPASLPPDGTFRADISVEDLAARGWDASALNASDFIGVVTLTLNGGEWRLHWGPRSTDDDCRGSYAVEEDMVRFTWQPNEPLCGPGFDDYTWVAGTDGLKLEFVGCAATGEDYSDGCLRNDRAFWGRTWTKIQ